MSLLAFLLACTGASTDDSGKNPTTDTTDTDTTDTDTTDTDTTDTDTTPTCDPMNSAADWAWYGACPQMRTPCDIVVTGCSFAIDYEADGGMTMSMPFGGTINGNVVTFNDDNGVTGCVGTLTAPDQIEGSCDGGCTFELHQ